MVRAIATLVVSAEFASLLAPLKEFDKFDGVSVPEQVKSQIKGKPLLHGKSFLAFHHHYSRYPQAAEL